MNHSPSLPPTSSPPAPPSHQQVNLGAPGAPDVLLYTDGSGYVDKFGGYCANAVSLRFNFHAMAAGGMLGVDVERAEFSALLEGLQLILQEANLATTKARAFLLLNPIRVTWFSDRESLVHSVTRGVDGQSINKRSASPDLWARFEYYEPMFQITAYHLPRNTNPNQAVADQISSDLRTLVKDYFELPHNSIQTLTTEQAAASIRAAFGLSDNASLRSPC